MCYNTDIKEFYYIRYIHVIFDLISIEVDIMHDICIIGAGVVGGCVARELMKYKLDVVIAEKMGDVAMGATKANSAIVHAGFDAKEGSLKAKLNVRGSKMMEEYCRELGVKYKNNGSLVLGFNDDDRETLNALMQRGIANGVEGLRVVDRDEVLKLEPNIGDEVVAALVAPTGGIVCPYELCMAAVGNAMDNGAELKLNFPVTRIEKTEKGYKVYSGDEFIEAEIVINCAGVYSDDVARMAGDSSFTVTPRRGEYILLDKEWGTLVSHTVFQCPSKMGKGILVTPTVDGNLLLGPTAEDISDKEDTSTTASGIETVKRMASRSVSGLNFGGTITSFTGLRATGSVGDFIINCKDGFVNCAGIESPGLSSAPAIAEYVRDLLIESGVRLTPRENHISKRKPLHAFRELSNDEKNEIIKEHPEYAHIICRCETISEGEILEAIRTNPKPHDLDGVKRRTRSGMGRCQGGFCAPYVVELLAKELGCDYQDITKFGGESYINIGKTKE